MKTVDSTDGVVVSEGLYALPGRVFTDDINKVREFTELKASIIQRWEKKKGTAWRKPFINKHNKESRQGE